MQYDVIAQAKLGWHFSWLRADKRFGMTGILDLEVGVGFMVLSWIDSYVGLV